MPKFNTNFCRIKRLILLPLKFLFIQYINQRIQIDNDYCLQLQRNEQITSTQSDPQRYISNISKDPYKWLECGYLWMNEWINVILCYLYLSLCIKVKREQTNEEYFIFKFSSGHVQACHVLEINTLFTFRGNLNL